jgi:hypothetical protein
MIDVLILLGIVLILIFMPTLVLRFKLFRLKGKLEAFCKKAGHTLTWHRSPLEALRFPKEGFDFEIRTKKRHYHVLMMSAKHKLREYSFLSPEEVAIYRKISFNLIARGRGRLRGVGRLNSVDFGLFAQNRPVSLNGEVPEGEEKILLFYPVPKDVTCIYGTKKRFVGNGDDLLNGYRLFTLSGFLRETENDALCRRKRKPWEEE